MAVYNLSIDRLAGGGEGVGRLPNGKVCFVPYTAPGDQVEVDLTEDKKRFARGRIVRILEDGPDRTAPECDVFGRCGGCDWQHLTYPAQLAAKNQLVRDHIARFLVDATPEIPDIIPSPEIWRYRSRARFRFQDGSPGFFAAGSHEVVIIDECPILQPDILPVAQDVGPAVVNGEREIRSPSTPQLHVADCTLQASPDSFTQVNPGINDLLVRYVLDRIGDKPKRLLDLFCGIGNMSLPAAHRGHTVIGVERSKQAIQDARDNAIRLALKDRTRFVSADVKRWMLKHNADTFDVILLDPPRSGAAQCLPHLPLSNQPDILYVSCDLPTLTRDLNTLHDAGYRTVRVQPFDMFPQTAHIELVAQLTASSITD